MSEGLNAVEREICRGDRINLAFVLYAALASGELRLTAGANDLPIEAGGPDATGGLYTTVGGFGPGLPNIDMAINGQVSSVTLELSGVDVATVQAMVLDSDEAIGAPAALGWAILDHRYRRVGPVRWPLRGHLFRPSVRKRRKQDGVSRERVISIDLVAGSWTRRRGIQAYLSGTDQRSRSPTDAACDRTGLLDRDATRLWPN